MGGVFLVGAYEVFCVDRGRCRLEDRMKMLGGLRKSRRKREDMNFIQKLENEQPRLACILIQGGRVIDILLQEDDTKMTHDSSSFRQ